MTRGHRPVVAIAEAKRNAAARGFLVLSIETNRRLPFDFAIDDRGEISRVRVRRLKYANYDPLRIRDSCRHEIEDLRYLQEGEKIHHELWVRGPDRAWHRYRVFPDAVEAIQEDAKEPGIHENGTINCERPFAGATVTERDATDIRDRVCETMAGANGYLQEQDPGKKDLVREAGVEPANACANRS